MRSLVHCATAVWCVLFQLVCKFLLIVLTALEYHPGWIRQIYLGSAVTPYATQQPSRSTSSFTHHIFSAALCLKYSNKCTQTELKRKARNNMKW